MDALYGIDRQQPSAEVIDEPDLPLLSEELLQRLYRGGEVMADTDTLFYNLDKFRQRLDTALGTDATLWGTRYAEMSLMMQRQMLRFCVAKNHSEMMSLQRLAAGRQGSNRSFEEFAERAARLHSLYNGAYLRTELDTAQTAVETGMTWQDVEQDKDIFPSLRYETAGDEHVRASHRILDGIVRPVDDDFWNTYYPPNGYNCRCTVVQTSERTTRLGMDKPLPIPELFEMNLAKKKYMFPPNHPYFERMQSRTFNEISDMLPVEKTYIDVKFPQSDTTIKVSAMQKDGEIIKNIETLRILSENGYKDMKLLPDLYSEEAKRRVYPEGQLPPDIKKNADAIINGNVYEIKKCSVDNINNNLSRAIKQAKRAVLNLHENPDNKTDNEIDGILLGNLRRKKSLEEIIAIYPDRRLHVFKR